MRLWEKYRDKHIEDLKSVIEARYERKLKELQKWREQFLKTVDRDVNENWEKFASKGLCGGIKCVYCPFRNDSLRCASAPSDIALKLQEDAEEYEAEMEVNRLP